MIIKDFREGMTQTTLRTGRTVQVGAKGGSEARIQMGGSTCTAGRMG